MRFSYLAGLITSFVYNSGGRQTCLYESGSKRTKTGFKPQSSSRNERINQASNRVYIHTPPHTRYSDRYQPSIFVIVYYVHLQEWYSMVVGSIRKTCFASQTTTLRHRRREAYVKVVSYFKIHFD